MKRGWLALGVAAGLIGAPAMADTLHLTSGVRLDGQVIENSDGTVTLVVEGRKLLYRADEIAVHEKNDRTGSEWREEAKQAAEEAKKAMQERTGLSEEQRAEVDRLLQEFGSTDRAVVREKVAQLVALGRRVDIVPYLQSLLPALTPATYPPALEAFCTLAKGSVVKEALSDAAAHPAFTVRAQAVRLMGTTGGSAGMVARGLVDPEFEVRLAAANALGDLGAKEATPALLDAMEKENASVRAVISRSLDKIWAGVEGKPNGSEVDKWQAFWASNQSGVVGSIQLSSLEPLVNSNIKFVEG